MIRAIIDTNVVLDALASREPFNVEAEKIFMLAAEEKFQGFITANSITDIYYLLRKTLGHLAARDALRNLLQVFTVVDISGQDCDEALDSPVSDYEDALVLACAIKAKVDYIVTRDEHFLKVQSTVAIASPSTFLEQI
jgi:putative PIN family toxin of toxin-antitoxin system